MTANIECAGGVCKISSTDLAYQEGADHFYGAERVDYPKDSPEGIAFNQGFKDELEAHIGTLESDGCLDFDLVYEHCQTSGSVNLDAVKKHLADHGAQTPAKL